MPRLLLVRGLTVLACLVLLPTALFAQASIAGVVKDTSGAVLPGVTVEAASPVLIEKTRSVVTDGAGQYKIIDLRPGTYSVTFSLAGFNTLKRDGIEVSGQATVSVPADMKVGAVAETITVTGAAPIVDIQSTTKQKVLDRETVDSLPTGRDQFQVAILIPGMGTSRAQDVGGTSAGQNANLMIHGSRGDAQRMTQNGLSTSTVASVGSTAGSVPNVVATQEVAIDVSAASAELSTGGVRMNVIPREGGNTFRGTAFGAFGNRAMQADNYSDRLSKLGLTQHSGHVVKNVYDINPGIGGPIIKDRLWFFGTVRYNVADNYAAGNTYFNLDPNAFVWRPDTSKETPTTFNSWKDASLRLTTQVSPRNKFAITYDQQWRCGCLGGTTTMSPEAVIVQAYPLQRIIQADWSSPISSKVLLEVVGLARIEGIFPQTAYPELQQSTPNIQFTDQGGLNPGMAYRGVNVPGNVQISRNQNWRASLSYVTGSHNIKVGYNDIKGANKSIYRDYPNYVTYRVNSGTPVNGVPGKPVPNQITLRANSAADISQTNLDHDFGLFAQDRWTYKRMTLSYGVRYDWFANSFPEQYAGPSPLAPNRNIKFAAVSGNDYKDITPKSGVVIDVFGNGKTAFRTTLNKYVEGMGAGGLAPNNPFAQLVNSTTRTWDDSFYPVGDPRRGNFVPDCDLVNPQKNAECAADANLLFGTTAISTTSTDPAVTNGWGHRGSNWEFSTGIQHEIMPRVSVDVGYYRRWYANMTVTDNLLTKTSDYRQFNLTVPSTAAPNGTVMPTSGQSLTYFDLSPTLNGQVQNLRTFSSKYGNEIDRWHGFDITVNARLNQGLTLQGGTSTGKTIQDYCDVAKNLPEILLGNRNYFGTQNGGGNQTAGEVTAGGISPSQFCHAETPWLTQIKGFATYTVPRIDLLVSATYQNVPGRPITSAVTIPAATITAILGPGSALSNNAPNLTVSMVTPGSLYTDRINQLDMRVGKVLRFGGGKRASVNLDLYNVFNQDTVLTTSNTFTNWQTPQTILAARLAKISAQFDF